MQANTAPLDINVCVSGRLTQHGQPATFDSFMAATHSDQLDVSGGCTDMPTYLSVTAIIGRQDGGSYRKQHFVDFLAQNGYAFEGEVWEEPNEDWH